MSLSPGWGWVLLTSLALNLFGAGFLVASSMLDTRGPDIQVVQAQEARWQVPPIVGRIVDDHRDTILPASRGLRDANFAVTLTLREDPFQPDAFATALEILRARTQESQQAMHDAILEASVAMTAAQRAELADVSRRDPGQLLLPR